MRFGLDSGFVKVGYGCAALPSKPTLIPNREAYEKNKLKYPDLVSVAGFLHHSSTKHPVSGGFDAAFFEDSFNNCCQSKLKNL